MIVTESGMVTDTVAIDKGALGDLRYGKSVVGGRNHHLGVGALVSEHDAFSPDDGIHQPLRPRLLRLGFRHAFRFGFACGFAFGFAFGFRCARRSPLRFGCTLMGGVASPKKGALRKKQEKQKKQVFFIA